MSISDNNVDRFEYLGGLIQIGSSTEAASTTINLINLTTVYTHYSATMTAPDANNDKKINVGEQFTLTHYVLGVPADKVTLTLQGTGTYTTATGTRTIIIGLDSAGHQQIVFPDGNAPVLSGQLVAVVSVSAAGYDPGTGTAVCFASGTLIETEKGSIPVERLRVGDRVLTLDNGYKPILWIGGRKVPAHELARYPNLRPIRIRAGSLGMGTPETDLLVSPQHRILIRSNVARRMFGRSEVLIAAKHLIEIDGIEVAEDQPSITYWHFLLDCHEIVFSNGAASETLFTGPQALASISPESRNEILALFPDLKDFEHGTPEPARNLVRGRLARNFASRLVKNQKPAVISMSVEHALSKGSLESA